MNKPDLSQIEAGSVIGLSMHGSIRNIAVVENVSSKGIIRASTLMGNYPIAFAKGELPSERNPGEDWRDAAMLNGSWAKGIEIGFAGEVPAEYADVISEAHNQMKGKSYGDTRRIYDSVAETAQVVIAYMNGTEIEQMPSRAPGM